MYSESNLQPMSPGWLYVVFPNWFLFNSPQFDLWMKLGEPATRISLLFKCKQKRSTSFAESNVLPFGPSGFLLPRLKWAARFSSEVEVVEHAEHKRGITQIEISRSPDVRLHRVAETPLSCQTDTNPVFRHHHPLPATRPKLVQIRRQANWKV